MFGFALKNPLITSIAVDEITPHIIIIVINTCTHARTHTDRHDTKPHRYTIHTTPSYTKRTSRTYINIYVVLCILFAVFMFFPIFAFQYITELMYLR